MTVTIPLWALWLFVGLVVVREFFLMRRDEAVGELWKMYLKQGAVDNALDECGIGGIYDTFRDGPDAIRQMGRYIRELERGAAVLPRDSTEKT